MADLRVTYTRLSDRKAATPQVPQGDVARSEVITIPGASSGATAGGLTAGAEDIIVSLHAGAACWVEVGTTPSPAQEEGHFIPADTLVYLGVSEGQKVAVIEA